MLSSTFLCIILCITFGLSFGKSITYSRLYDANEIDVKAPEYDHDIWSDNLNDGNLLIFETISDETLDEICRDSKFFVHIKQIDKTIDCQHHAQHHFIDKRNADDAEDTGSGDGEKLVESEVPTETYIGEAKLTDSPRKDADVEVKDLQPDVPKPDLDTPPVTTEEEAINKEATTAESPHTDTTKELPNADKEATTGIEDSKSKISKEDNTSIVPSNKSGETTEKSGSDDETITVAKEIELLNNSDKSDSGNKTGGQKKGRMMKHPDAAPTDVKETGDVKTGESQDAEVAKSNNILLFLFIGVATVGILAFAYSFIRKRRSHSSDIEHQAEEIANRSNSEELKVLMTKPIDSTENISNQENEKGEHEKSHEASTNNKNGNIKNKIEADRKENL